MTLVLNDEQRMLKESVQDFLTDNAPVDTMRRLRDEHDPLGYSADLWRQLAELGVPAAALPEAYGGHGFGYQGLGAACEAMGRNLTASPLLATVVLGASVLELAGSDDQKERLLPAIAEGRLTLALAVDEHCHHRPLHTTSRLTDSKGGYVLSGKKVFVQDGHSADHLLVVARSAGEPGERQGLSLVLLPRETPGITVNRTRMMDGRNAAEIRFDDVPVASDQLVGDLHQGYEPLQTALDRGAACLAAEMLGGILETFERTVEYLKEREQFGVKIGSFQALQHRAAQMFCQIELCKSAVLAALDAIDRDDPALPLKASQAKALANDCFQHVSNEAIQMHGGMGITDELDIGLFLKRARVAIQTLGDSHYHRDRYARILGY